MSQPPVPSRRLKRPVIFLCDLQEKFAPAIWEFDKVVLTAKKLLKMAQPLRIPIYVTTQNLARLGPVVSDLHPLLSAGDTKAEVDKTSFSMWVPELAAQFHGEPPCEVALVGIEAHICITQTALDLLANGHVVYVLADGVSSCNREEVAAALARLRAEGVRVTTSESFIYECMGDAAIPEFKSVMGVLKETTHDTKAALSGLLSRM